ncbi:response regulator [Aliivibrio sp. S3MY1]|uniref:response regulator n=1 Tax=unclassified Aliivibrio TaxID=2645654 RepID=UPI00237991BC|nr:MULTISPECIES: response regulator [unclassified Aliivibrio]MDD9194435.1 response regulator [Aliivibrio sp. S3MY1]MDD9198226.1 response regulator [Aliivibrio sp. S2MY1]
MTVLNKNKLNTNKFNILIVDDCQVSSLYLSKLLSQLGFNSIDRVNSYQQAVKFCSKKHYSLLFIDYHLEQVLNGSELYDLLKEKGFIQAYTRVITISGDHTTQTVLSTLSKGNGDYLCKPVSKSILSHKVNNAYDEYQMFKSLHSPNNTPDLSVQKEQAIKYAKIKNINELDQFLFNLFLPNEKEKLLKLCLNPEFIHRRNYILTRLRLEYELSLTPVTKIINNTEKLCLQYPLFVDAFDLLVELQIELHHFENALLSASSALDLTPSISVRALGVLKLALTCNNKNYFIKASHLLANHLPIANQNWCVYIAECFNYYDEYIQHSQSEFDKKQLLLEQKNFVRRSEYRLTSTQKKQMTVLFSFSECKRLINNNDIIKAKRMMLKSVQPFFDNLHQLNSVVLVELLYLLSFCGELWLLEKVNAVMKTKHHFNDYCIDALNLLKHDKELKESLEILSNTLQVADNLQDENIQTRQEVYKKALVQFPYSSELCIGLLECYILLSLDKPETISILISLVNNMPLSEHLMKRRDAVLKALHTHEGYIEEISTAHFDVNNDDSYQLKDTTLLNLSRRAAHNLLS